MLTFFDYASLWGAFFITGVVLGFALTSILMQPGKSKY